MQIKKIIIVIIAVVLISLTYIYLDNQNAGYYVAKVSYDEKNDKTVYHWRKMDKEDYKTLAEAYHSMNLEGRFDQYNTSILQEGAMGFFQDYQFKIVEDGKTYILHGSTLQGFLVDEKYYDVSIYDSFFDVIRILKQKYYSKDYFNMLEPYDTLFFENGMEELISNGNSKTVGINGDMQMNLLLIHFSIALLSQDITVRDSI